MQKQQSADEGAKDAPKQYGAINWELIERIKQLSASEKNERAFAAGDFALRQKKLILTEKHPEWLPKKVDREARRIVFGVYKEMLPGNSQP